ncbi:hypothetical protein M4L39_09820 [Staphylococcus equorum]|uniref:Uncharacterized protein n=1 Tax=Staphylococcus equorum TaxID=246432 RepID=A0A9X4R2C9_9STAP|nr:hypothetical protein [Staphylococcus equorum]MDG0843742.1 hypothetical protein [Staphylococcus equorum]MDG0859739.1 hypothetical protein [Staphylococcus equorum]
MSKSVKLVVSIYLGVVFLITFSYLIMILIGSIQGNDMKGAVLDTANPTNLENVEYNNESSSGKTSTESNSVPDELQSNLTNTLKTKALSHNVNSHTWSLDHTQSKSHV